MRKCSNCDAPLGWLSGNGQICSDCYAKKVAEQRGIAKSRATIAAEEKSAAEEARKVAARTIIVTTETAMVDLKVEERLGVVAGECVFGMHVFKDIFADVRDLVGGRSGAMQKTFRDARTVALDEMRLQAYNLGADAVVAVDLDYSDVGGAGKMIMVAATGTAVKISQQ